MEWALRLGLSTREKDLRVVTASAMNQNGTLIWKIRESIKNGADGFSLPQIWLGSPGGWWLRSIHWLLRRALAKLLLAPLTATSDSKVYSGIIYSSSLVSVLDIHSLHPVLGTDFIVNIQNPANNSFSFLNADISFPICLAYTVSELFLVDSEFPLGFLP